MKPIASYQKLRGGYYTPEPIAAFLADWAIQDPQSSVLEPSCGDGVLLEAAVKTLLARGSDLRAIGHQIIGVELDAIESRKANDKLDRLGVPAVEGQIRVGDFFSQCRELLATNCLFDAIVGNPPFIRYQNFPEEHRDVAFQLMGRAGLLPNRLTNSWVPFLVAAMLLLKPHGRLAMVIPAELLQVNYAARLRRLLSDRFSAITLLTFKKLLFEGVQQEVVLFLGERDGIDHTGIRTIELETMDDLVTYQHDEFMSSPLKPMSHSTEKWTQYFLDPDEIMLLRELRSDTRIARLGDVADVDVGIVTGLNQFFVLTSEQAETHELLPYARRIVGRSNQLQGIVFTDQDWMTQAARDLPTQLLVAPDVPFDQLPAALQTYVRIGEEANYHEGYKCRIRKRWYVVPSYWIPDAFMLRQVHDHPKLVLNAAQTTCTDTIHRVRLRSDLQGSVISSAFMNSLTFAFSEVLGRSYGGGVLELEPNEAEQLLLPLDNAQALDIDELDHLERANNTEGILDTVDRILLTVGLGLSASDVGMLRGIWRKLSHRRINRKYRPSLNGSRKY
ncbi:MAG: class I SAM-dependent methyltransferase [Anaerolineae bacterium]